MPVNFKEDLSVAPLPLSEVSAAVLARQLAGKIAAAGGRDNAARMAVDAILARPATELPTEHGRLQRLYAQVYTRTELERLMLSTFDALALKD